MFLQDRFCRAQQIIRVAALHAGPVNLISLPAVARR
jgi:hypothetical protein